MGCATAVWIVALLVAGLASGQSPYTAVYTSSVPSVSCVEVYLQAADFRTPSDASMLPMATVPLGWQPVSVRLSILDPFLAISPRVSDLAVSLGTAAHPEYYCPATWMGSREVLGGQAADSSTQTLYAWMRVTNPNPDDLSSLTSGLLAVKVCGTVLPQTVPPPPPVTGIPTMGTLVNGKCQTQGSGFRLTPDGRAMVSDEPQANCAMR